MLKAPDAKGGRQRDGGGGGREAPREIRLPELILLMKPQPWPCSVYQPFGGSDRTDGEHRKQISSSCLDATHAGTHTHTPTATNVNKAGDETASLKSWNLGGSGPRAGVQGEGWSPALTPPTEASEESSSRCSNLAPSPGTLLIGRYSLTYCPAHPSLIRSCCCGPDLGGQTPY